MLSLGRQVGIDYDQLGWIVASRSIGFLLSALLFGVIFQSMIKKNPTLLLSIGYIFPAIGIMIFYLIISLKISFNSYWNKSLFKIIVVTLSVVICSRFVTWNI